MIQESSLELPVTVRGTGRATIHARIFENTGVAQGATILDVHGAGTTGRVFDPLTRALFDDPMQGARVKRVITIDMIGHGGSSMPTNLPRGLNFGSLTLGDNVSVIRQSIDALRARSLAPQLLVGHSMGALALTAVQEQLLAEGSSFAKLGVSTVLLIAPIPAHGLPWTQPSSQQASTLEPYFVMDPVKGIHISVPPDIWIAASFTDRSGKLAPTTPTPAEAQAAGYMAIEPLLTLLELSETNIALPGIPARNTNQRPTVRPGAFAPANGTRLAVVSFSEDLLCSPADVLGYYRHLTGDTGEQHYLQITSPEAVHNMTISRPDFVIEAMKVLFR